MTVASLGQVAVPMECSKLAAEHKVAAFLTSEREVTRAIAKLAWLSVRHPKDQAIRSCREIVREMWRARR